MGSGANRFFDLNSNQSKTLRLYSTPANTRMSTRLAACSFIRGRAGSGDTLVGSGDLQSPFWQTMWRVLP
jgi:hypothetical protein